MRQHLPKHFMIFSVENPKYKVSASNPPDNNTMIRFLQDQGEDADVLHGHYDNAPEKSIIVRHPKNIRGITEMARALGQESIIHSIGNSNELKYINGPKNGTSVLGNGVQFYNEKPDGDHSLIHTESGPVYFKINFDFPKEEPTREMASLRKSEVAQAENLLHRIRTLEHNRRANMADAEEYAKEVGHSNPKFFFYLRKLLGD